jgi:hypothetical protein
MIDIFLTILNTCLATNFEVLAELFLENSRACDDGLYRAIDTYLKVTY